MMIRYILILSICLLSMSTVYADWSGPDVVIYGNWGGDQRDFGLRETYYREISPRFLDVDEQGNIAIADPVNRRIKLYDQNGKLQRLIHPILPFEDQLVWPNGVVRIGKGRLAVNFKKSGLQIYDYSGRLLKSLEETGSLMGQHLPDGQFLTSMMRTYSADGMLMAVDGDVLTYSYDLKEEKLWSERYRVFHGPEGDIRIFSRPQIADVIMNDSGKLYATVYDRPEGLGRVSRCGKLSHRFSLPQNRPIVYRPNDVGDWNGYDYVPEYGAPQITPAGNILIWEKTAKGFSLLRWTWQGPLPSLFNTPYYPRFLVATPGNDGIEVSWDSSYSDPGCVSEYQVSRSAHSGGPYQSLGTVAAGELSFTDDENLPAGTYYYVVRALNNETTSGFSNESSVEEKP